MIKGGKGGGNTRVGIEFEARVDLLNQIDELPGYEIDGNNILYKGTEVALFFKKRGLYRHLEGLGVDYRQYISKRLEPDNALYVINNNTIFIIEIKFQNVSGSVDEKLQTCDFKKKQYMKLFSSLNYEVEYIYILSEWFKKEEYKDVRDYIISVGCRFYFEFLPLHELGLPVPKKN
jgi:hypothetical protein